MVAVGDTLNNRYHLEQQIGRGGFAKVYLGTDLLLKRQVAIKVLNADLTDDPTFLARFEREAQSVAALEHPNILPIYDYGHVETPTTAYLVMPFIAGGTLQHRLTAAGRLSLPEASAHLRQVAAALDYAHKRGIVHRDIKPLNMLLREDGYLFLADFGIAKVLQDTKASSSSSVVGTLTYMAPEQFAGKASPATDVYALGCVLFELLTGEPPYTGPTQQVMHGHLMSPVPSVVARAGGRVPDALQPVFERALAKEPTDRFPSAGDLARAVQGVVEGNISSQAATVQGVTVPALTPLAATIQAAPVTAATAPAHTPSAATVPAYDAQAATIHAHTPLPVPNPVRRMGRDAIAASVAGVGVVLLLCVVGVALAMAARGGGVSPTVTSAFAAGVSASTATPAPVAAPASTATPAPVVASPTPLAVAFAPTAAPTIPPTATTIPPTATTIPPTATPRPPTATTAPPTATVPPVAVVRFAGEVLLAGNLDFDKMPPQSGGGGDELFAVGDDFVVTPNSVLKVARWTGPSPPTAAQCADAAARLHVGTNYSFEKPNVGLALCIVTTEGRVAFLTLKEVIQGVSNDSFLFDATVWEKPR